MDTTANRSTNIHLGLAWNWQYDHDFIQLLDRAVGQAGLTAFVVGAHNLQHTMHEVQAGMRDFACFLDRASDNDDRFLAFNHLLEAKGTRFLNAHHHYRRSIDKANIHGELFMRGLQLPLTIIIPALETEPHFDLRIVNLLPKPFVAKPSRGGGGVGVIMGGMRLEEVKQARMHFRNQRYLIQQRIEPQVWFGRRAWFRVFHVCGTCIPCWWDEITHRYTAFTPADAEFVDANELICIARVIAEVSHLDFFSTEIALDRNGHYVAVDYVNDPCDMRLQSKCHDGVPDQIVAQVIGHIVAHVKKQFAVVAAPV